MSKLIAVISPAKLLDDQTHYPNLPCTQPEFTAEAKKLAALLQKMSPAELSKLMAMSSALGKETALKFDQWQLPFTHENAHPAMLMFKGEVYRGLQAEELHLKQLEFAQKHVRILSGLYGILRPLDLIMPYRLMMGTPLSIGKTHKNLYAFWSEKITTHLDQALDKKGILMDLASSEYFKSIDLKTLNRKVISCEFRQKKGNDYVVVNTYAKSARGKMTRFIIDNAITKADDCRAFDYDGYSLLDARSDDERLVFVR
jgi:cytoplasmic iron level regulating protein YaaA (DUF328/UPF0246 family)